MTMTTTETSRSTTRVYIDQTISSTHEAFEDIVVGSSATGWTVAAYIGATTAPRHQRRDVSRVRPETRLQMAALYKRMRKVLADNPSTPAGPAAGNGFRTELAMLASARGRANARLLGDAE
jgi:hypothetical protein